jgi:hypothetical protein
VKTHIFVGGRNGTLCGNRSRAAYLDRADCDQCNGRFAMLLLAALDITEYRPRAVERMKKLIEKLRIVRYSMPQPEENENGNVQGN